MKKQTPQEKAEQYVRDKCNIKYWEDVELHHWLGVLGECTADLSGNYLVALNGDLFHCVNWHKVVGGDEPIWKPHTPRVRFSMQTGQPSSPEDYEALCKIFYE
jgi:hypothetical protein